MLTKVLSVSDTARLDTLIGERHCTEILIQAVGSNAIFGSNATCAHALGSGEMLLLPLANTRDIWFGGDWVITIW